MEQTSVALDGTEGRNIMFNRYASICRETKNPFFCIKITAHWQVVLHWLSIGIARFAFSRSRLHWSWKRKIVLEVITRFDLPWRITILRKAFFCQIPFSWRSWYKPWQGHHTLRCGLDVWQFKMLLDFCLAMSSHSIRMMMSCIPLKSRALKRQSKEAMTTMMEQWAW